MTPSASFRVLAVVSAALLLAGCAATTPQHVGLTLRSDTLTREGWPRLTAAQRAALERQVTVVLPCSSEGADATPSGECALLADRVRIEPIRTHLGSPPQPAEIASRSGLTGLDRASRERVRAAYADEVRARYRTYATYISSQLAGVDSIEIPDPNADGAIRRYRGREISGGLDEALVAMGDRYAALEWYRFERQQSYRPSTARTRDREAAPREEHAARAPGPSHPSAPPAAVPSVIESRPSTAIETGPSAESAAPETPAPSKPPPDEIAVPETPAPSKPAPDGRPGLAMGSGDAPCRRTCGLRRRACLAGCRERPISESASYEACAGTCRDSDAACRGRCGDS